MLRIVNILETDIEACCGTHCDSTAEIGWIKILKSIKIQDGVVRIYFVSGFNTIGRLNQDNKIINDLCQLWSIDRTQLLETGDKFFKDYKVYKS